MEKFTVLLAIMAILGFGLSSFFDKLAVNAAGPAAGLIVYFITSAGFLFNMFLNKSQSKWDFAGLRYAVISGIFAAIGGLGFFIALQNENVSLVTPFSTLYPAVAVLLGLIFLHEKIKLVNAAGIVLALIAGVLLAL